MDGNQEFDAIIQAGGGIDEVYGLMRRRFDVIQEFEDEDYFVHNGRSYCQTLSGLYVPQTMIAGTITLADHGLVN